MYQSHYRVIRLSAALVASVTAVAISAGGLLAAASDTKETVDSKENPPLRYFIGREVVVVNVTTTTKTTRQIAVVNGKDRTTCEKGHGSDPDYCVVQSHVDTRDGLVTTKLVPDPELSADIDVAARAFSDNEMVFELRDGMLLKSINIKSTGRAGEVVTAIAKIAGSLTGITGWRAESDKAVPRMVSACDPFKKPFLDLPDTVRLLTSENDDACQRYLRIIELQEHYERLIEGRLKSEDDILGAAPGIDLQDKYKKLKAVEATITTEADELAKRQVAFTAILDAFTARLRLGTVTTVTNHSQVLKLSDLPPSTPNLAGTGENEARQIADAYGPAAKSLYDSARVIVTFDPVAPVLCDPDPSIPNGGRISDNKSVSIYFRQGAPARMRVFIADQTEDPKISKLRSVADRFDNFVHDCLPVGVMTFKASAWGNRGLSLTFDDKGRPVTVDRSSTSDAAAIAGSIAAAASTFRDEMATTVAKAVDVQTNRRKLELGDLATKIEKTKAEKDALDAQLSLDTATANFDTLLMQKRAAAGLERLQAELALVTAQSTSDQTQQIAEMKVAIDQIMKQIELLRAQQDLDRLKK